VIQTKQSRYDTNLKVCITNKEISEVRGTNFLEVLIDSDPLGRHILTFAIRLLQCTYNRLYEITEVDVMRTVYYGLVYQFLSYGITVYGH
jgi:hypothetical protein